MVKVGLTIIVSHKPDADDSMVQNTATTQPCMLWARTSVSDLFDRRLATAPLVLCWQYFVHSLRSILSSKTKPMCCPLACSLSEGLTAGRSSWVEECVGQLDDASTGCPGSTR